MAAGKPTVYVETTIFSVLVARPTKNLIATARQETTRIWWQNDADAYSLVTSEMVQWETAQGDPEMARQRFDYIQSLPRLSSTSLIYDLADGLIVARILPPKARIDAVHLCTATVHKIPYIVTWNFRHLVNAHIFPQVMRYLQQLGYNPPYVCTPDQLSKVANA